MKKTMMIAASLAVLAGCAKVEAPQQEATQEENGVQVITAFVKEDATKVAISSDDNTLFDHKWQAGDEISLFDNGTNRQYTLKTGAGDRSATFSGATLSETTPYYALYPYNSEATIAGSTITTTFPAVQTYTAGGYDPAALVMIAQSADANSFGFKLASSILQITLTPTSDYTVKTVEITANGGESIAGTGNVDWNEGNPTVTMTSGVPTVTVSFGEGVALTTGTPYTFYVALPAVTLSSGVSVAVTGSDNKMLLKKSSTLALTRNYVTKMPALTAVPSVINLSLANSASAGLATPETANCYLVNTDGKYAIPIDTKGNSTEITLKGIKSVEKVWDNAGTISNLKLYGKYLQFDVDEPATNNNAVVAAKVDETIVWSWHIWTNTEYDLAPSKDVRINDTWDFMPMSVGATTKNKYGDWADGTLYQWGRKDPITFDTKVINPGAASQNLTWSISHPQSFSSGWLTGSLGLEDVRREYWSTSIDKGETTVVKTIYDPSPVGYNVFPKAAMVYLATHCFAGHEAYFISGTTLFVPKAKITGFNTFDGEGYMLDNYVWIGLWSAYTSTSAVGINSSPNVVDTDRKNGYRIRSIRSN